MAGKEDEVVLDFKSGGFTPGELAKSGQDKGAPAAAAETPKEVPKEAPKDAPKETAKTESGAKSQGAKVDVVKTGATTGAGRLTVKCQKNQFALNRLLLMLMDVRPEVLSQETIDDLKKIYALLVNIQASHN